MRSLNMNSLMNVTHNQQWSHAVMHVETWGLEECELIPFPQRKFLTLPLLKYEEQAYENEQCVDANHIKQEMNSNKDYKQWKMI